MACSSVSTRSMCTAPTLWTSSTAPPSSRLGPTTSTRDISTITGSTFDDAVDDQPHGRGRLAGSLLAQRVDLGHRLRLGLALDAGDLGGDPLLVLAHQL